MTTQKTLRHFQDWQVAQFVEWAFAHRLVFKTMPEFCAAMEQFFSEPQDSAE